MPCVTCVFIPKQRNAWHLDLTNQSSGNRNELYQLSVRANECGYMFVIDCSLASDRDQNVLVRICPRLTFKNDPPFKVCNKLFLRKVNHCFSSANPFGCSNLEINIQRKEQRKERLANICPFNEASMLQQLCLISIWRKRTGSTDSTLNLLVPVNMFLSPSSSQIINKWTALESNWLRQVRKTRITLIAQSNTRE